jgi:hypothetical protein
LYQACRPWIARESGFVHLRVGSQGSLPRWLLSYRYLLPRRRRASWRSRGRGWLAGAAVARPTHPGRQRRCPPAAPGRLPAGTAGREAVDGPHAGRGGRLWPQQRRQLPPNPTGCRKAGRIVKLRRHSAPGEAEATPRLLQLLHAWPAAAPTQTPGPAGWSAATWSSARARPARTPLRRARPEASGTNGAAVPAEPDRDGWRRSQHRPPGAWTGQDGCQRSRR